MSEQRISQALGRLDARHVEEAADPQSIRRRATRTRRTVWTACACLCAVVAGLLLSVWPRTLTADFPADLPVGPSGGELAAVVMEADWPHYETAGALVRASEQVFSGTVTEVSFVIVTPQSEIPRPMLYTVYTVAVGKSFKGEVPDEVRIGVMGGILGYREEEQLALLREAGLYEGEYAVMVVTPDASTLAPGQEYLFCTAGAGEDFLHIVNPNQFAHRSDSTNADRIRRACWS